MFNQKFNLLESIVIKVFQVEKQFSLKVSNKNKLKTIVV